MSELVYPESLAVYTRTLFFVGFIGLAAGALFISKGLDQVHYHDRGWWIVWVGCGATMIGTFCAITWLFLVMS